MTRSHGRSATVGVVAGIVAVGSVACAILTDTSGFTEGKSDSGLACPAGRGDCDGLVVNGCEETLASSHDNCGACGHACKFAEVCDLGVCAGSCSGGRIACSGACAEFSSDAKHCGSCDNACGNPGNATATCVASACDFECNQGLVKQGGACVDPTTTPPPGSGDSGTDGGDAGPGAPFPSCVGLAKNCGDGTRDCCESTLVAGGSFNRSNDPDFPATISSFKLDVYPITVGRFRTFVNAGKGTQASPPVAGSGNLPPTSPAIGWLGSDALELPADTTALKATLSCQDSAWTDTVGGNDTKPMGCITWFEAYAFCIWDGGRLPTEAEYNYAAAGGNEQRPYPWGDAGPDALHATFNSGALTKVGKYSPLGDGKYGQADLSGNVWEFTLDWYHDPYGNAACTNCVDLSPAGIRSIRGGSTLDSEEYLATTLRGSGDPASASYRVGGRCARPAE